MEHIAIVYITFTWSVYSLLLYVFSLRVGATSVYLQVMFDVQDKMALWFNGNVNDNNETLQDVFPYSSTESFAYNLVTEVSSNLLFFVSYAYYENMYDIIVPFKTPVNATYGSQIYYTTVDFAVESMLHSGTYATIFANNVNWFGLYSAAGATNVTFDEFVEQLYHEFNMEEAFYTIFRFTYEEMYTSLVEYGTNLYENTDMATLTTDYMR